jgi:CRP-like cAMP-binding protein
LLAATSGDTLAAAPSRGAHERDWGFGMAAGPEIVQALSNTDLFAAVGTKALNAIAAQARVVSHPEGKDITEEGGGAAGFHLIRSGQASVKVRGHDRPDLGPGDYFGEISMIDGKPRSATVHAKTPVTTISLASWAFHPILDEHPDVGKELLKVMCSRLRAAEA